MKLAHKNNTGEEQSLEDHSFNVANKARGFIIFAGHVS